MAISTDKAVNPVNLYGATKLCQERIIIQANVYSGGRDVRFACVRYGNVVGSRGSVVPLFLEQRKTGALSITHPEMTRFWITLPQAVRFVCSCIEAMNGGEVFVPKIPSTRVVDLARVIAPQCEQKIIGIRPGEKIHEVLLTEEESRHSVELEDHFVIEPEFHWWDPDIRRPPGARALPERFRYASDTNEQWLTNQEVYDLLVQQGFLSSTDPRPAPAC
jgi:UDP-N-acetylglucosamine 4,6-dehydratase